MRMTTFQIVATMAAIAAGCQLTRWLPFLLFPENKTPPKVVQYLGRVLPAAMLYYRVQDPLVQVQEKTQEMTAEQINAEIARIAELYHMEKDKVTEYVSRDNIKKDVEVEAAMKLVRDSAKITDKKPETDDKKPEAAKPAKKTTARKTTKKAAEEPKAEPEVAPEAK